MYLSRTAARLALAAATIALAVAAGPAGAVLNGTADTANRFANVGALQLKVGTDWFQFCSGALVRPNVVLTAAHCTDFVVDVGADGFGPDDVRITFDPEQDGPYYTVDHIAVHPDWFTQPGGQGNSKHGFLAPPAEDIALVFLDSTVAGVTPAPIAGPSYLAGLDLKKASFTAVGYGTDGFASGNAGSNHPFVIDDGIRSYRDATLITEHDAFPDRFLKVTQSVCFGDSGGPLFHNGTVVALNTWTFSYRCSGPNLEYWVDSAAARSFLAANL
jgi:Trypsin